MNLIKRLDRVESLFEHMLQAPHQYDLAQILTILQNLSGGDNTKIKIATRPSLVGDAPAIDVPVRRGDPFCVWSDIYSFFGPDGSLPLGFEDMIAHHPEKEAILDFLSIFYQRFIEIWMRYESLLNPAISQDPFQNVPFITIPLVYSGLYGLDPSDSLIPDHFYIQNFDIFHKNAALKKDVYTLVNAFLKLHQGGGHCEDVETKAGWQYCDDAGSFTLLGKTHSRLGYSALIGKKQWDLNRALFIHISGIHESFWFQLQKKDLAYNQLSELLHRAFGKSFHMYIVGTIHLTQPSKPFQGSRLGQNTWIGKKQKSAVLKIKIN